MTENSTTLESKFDAALSKADLDEGELLHSNVESIRRITMAAGLTNSSHDLEAICSANPKEFQDVLNYGLESFDHYQNLLLLLENAISRIYSVALENPNCMDELNSEEFKEKMAKVISTRTEEKPN